MSHWFERDPERLAVEAHLMQTHTRASLFNEAGTLFWLEDIESASGGRYRARFVYPERFPFERPRAFIIHPRVTSAPHRFSDGSLCLFDNPCLCDVKITALVVRNRTVIWILAYEIWQRTQVWMPPGH